MNRNPLVFRAAGLTDNSGSSGDILGSSKSSKRAESRVVRVTATDNRIFDMNIDMLHRSRNNDHPLYLSSLFYKKIHVMISEICEKVIRRCARVEQENDLSGISNFPVI